MKNCKSMLLPKTGPVGNKVLIFFHIAKTAGITLHEILKRNFSDNAIMSMNYGEDSECVDKLSRLPEKRKVEIKYLHAHMMPFGIHKYLPPSTYIILLRDPVDRVISEYYYIRQVKVHPQHDLLVSKNMSLRDYVTSGIATGAVQSGQTRLLSGVKGVDWTTGSGPISRDILEIAKKNLKKYFALVGLTERFDESLILLKQAFGWKNTNLIYRKQNVTRGRPRKSDISKDVLNLIEQYNELDLELYDFAQKRFNKLIREQGSSFAAELQIFQAWNRAYDRYFKLRSVFRPVKRVLLWR